MKPAQAASIVGEIERVCRKHNLFFTVEFENKPDLKMIRVKEISIKVDEKE